MSDLVEDVRSLENILSRSARLRHKSNSLALSLNNRKKFPPQGMKGEVHRVDSVSGRTLDRVHARGSPDWLPRLPSRP